MRPTHLSRDTPNGYAVQQPQCSEAKRRSVCNGLLGVPLYSPQNVWPSILVAPYISCLTSLLADAESSCRRSFSFRRHLSLAWALPQGREIDFPSLTLNFLNNAKRNCDQRTFRETHLTVLPFSSRSVAKRNEGLSATAGYATEFPHSKGFQFQTAFWLQAQPISCKLRSCWANSDVCQHRKMVPFTHSPSSSSFLTPRNVSTLIQLPF